MAHPVQWASTARARVSNYPQIKYHTHNLKHYGFEMWIGRVKEIMLT